MSIFRSNYLDRVKLPTPNPSQEGNCLVRQTVFPSWEGLGVGLWLINEQAGKL
jgi:hypothetical protein